jgi:ubiquitin-conjugating enzyme E2 variant
MRTLLLVSSGVLEAIAVLALVDLVSGLIHWVEDTFWTEKTPVLGRWVVTPNVLHHHSPSAFVEKSWLESSWDLLLLGLGILAAAWATHSLTWQVWLFVVVGANANQIHKWAHLPARRLPWAIRALQRVGVLQSSAHHAAHHRGAKNTAYCVITPWVNPVLDRLGVWRALERLLVRRGAARRRTDLAGPDGARASVAGAVLAAVLVLGLGSGCAPSPGDESTPGIVSRLAGPETAAAYLRAGAPAVATRAGVPCSPIDVGRPVDRPTVRDSDGGEQAVGRRSPPGARR